MDIWPSHVKVFTDGASRGNPGPASIGVIFYDLTDQILDTFKARLGTQTNNFAEYMAVIKALSLGQDHGVSHIEVYSDSQLLVYQMQKKYKVKSPPIRKLYIQAQELIQGFVRVQFFHIPRESNTIADQLANEALDELGLL